MESNFIQEYDWGTIEWIRHTSSSDNSISLTSIATFKPHSTQPLHYHLNEEQLIYVIEGSGYQILDGLKTHFTQGMTFFSPSLCEHAIVNTENYPLKLLIIYTKTFYNNQNSYSGFNLQEKDIELINPAVLKSIANEFSNMLSLNITILSSTGEVYYANHFNNLAITSINKNILQSGKERRTIVNTITSEDNLVMNSPLIQEISLPISYKNITLGYIKCQYFIIRDSFDESSFHKLLDYEHLPNLQFNQIISVLSFFKNMSSFIVNDIIKQKISQELINKNTEVLQKSRNIMELENIIRNMEASNYFNKNKYKQTRRFNIAKIPYSIETENQIINSIESLDIDEFLSSFKYINAEQIGYDGFCELSISISKVFYKLTKDDEKYNKIRFSLSEIINTKEDLAMIEKKLKGFIVHQINEIRVSKYPSQNVLIENVKNYIIENYDTKITLNKLASVFHINPNYLSSLINNNLHLSLTDFTNQVRVEKSKEILETTNFSISEVSKKVGFNSPSYYIANFKKYLNMTPKEYRAQKNKA